MGITRFIDRSAVRLRTYLDMLREVANEANLSKADIEHLSERTMKHWEEKKQKNAEHIIFTPINSRKKAIIEIVSEYKTLLKPVIKNTQKREETLHTIENTFEKLFEI